MQSCLIIEDDFSHALDTKMIVFDLGYTTIDIASTIDEAKSFLKKHEYDIILSDVLLGNENAVDYFNSNKKRNNLLYFSAHNDNHTYKRIQEKGSHIFLVKPFDKKTLRSCIEVLAKSISSKKDNPELVVRTKGVVKKIKISEILYIKSVGNDCEIVTIPEAVITRNSLTSYQDELVDKGFYKVHRSYLINLRKVTKIIPGKSIIIIEDVNIPIGRKNKKQFLAEFKNFKF